MERPIPVVEVHAEADRWEAWIDPVFASEDVETVDALDETTAREELVNLPGGARRLRVYRTGPSAGWIRWSDL